MHCIDSKGHKSAEKQLELFNPSSRISHLSGSHPSLTHAIDHNPIVKELIRLAKKFNYHFTHH